MALTQNRPLTDITVTGYSSSIGATPVAAYIRSPCRGRVIKVGVVQSGAVTGTATLAFAINGTANTSGDITVTAGAAGGHFSRNPSAGNNVVEDDVISLTPSGATGTVTGAVYAVIRKS